LPLEKAFRKVRRGISDGKKASTSNEGVSAGPEEASASNEGVSADPEEASTSNEGGSADPEEALTSDEGGSAGPEEAFSGGYTQFPPSTFIAAVFGSPKNTGSTCSTISALTSRKFRLFSIGTSALFAPLSFAT